MLGNFYVFSFSSKSTLLLLRSGLPALRFSLLREEVVMFVSSHRLSFLDFEADKRFAFDLLGHIGRMSGACYQVTVIN